MKHFKKFFSYLVALTMVLSLAAFTGVKVYAEGSTSTPSTPTTYKITLGDASNTKTTNHTYHAYQIFSGDLSKKTVDGKEVKVLSNIQWGTGIDSTKTDTLINALKTNETLKTKFGDAKDAASVAKALEGVSSNSKEMDEFAQVVGQYLSGTSKSSSVNSETTEITGLNAGYYLVKDTLDTDKDGKVKNENDAYTKFIVDVVGDTTATIKSDVPTVVKKVKDTNDSTGTTSDWQDSADADINDDVQYQITGTMPANIADYKTYKYVFTDTMSKGLTYTAKNAKITIGGKDVTSSFTENVEAVKDTNGEKTGETKVTWSIDNIKNIIDPDDHTKKIAITSDTTVIVTYTAKLNKDAALGAAGNPNTVDLTYSNNPNKGGSGETGKTPEDKNIVFTYKTVFNKVDQDGNGLAGADFKLEKYINGNWSALANSKSNDNKFNDEAIKSNDGKTFTFKGLDDGIYRLVETTTPDGYNTMKPMEFEITADHRNDNDPDKKPLTLQELKMDKVTDLKVNTDQTLELQGETNYVSGDTNAGSMTTNVKNKKGSTLPSTGGMGTTLLYVAGGILVACAAAYVVMSRKHSTNK